MKFELLAITAVLASNLVSAQENSSADAFIDLKGIRNSFVTTSDIFSRFINLLYGSLATTEPSETRTKPQIAKPFRRLNIFGLQLPPVEPPTNPDGTLCSSCSQDLVPDILSVTAKPEDSNTPSFFVVAPPGPRSERLSATQPTHHYPKLDIEELKKAPENLIDKQENIVG